jgi:hypothetical protein
MKKLKLSERAKVLSNIIRDRTAEYMQMEVACDDDEEDLPTTSVYDYAAYYIDKKLKK